MEITLEQLIEWAEQEGERKEWINAELKDKPNSERICDCKEPVRYEQVIFNGQYNLARIVCLRCGGIVLN